MKKKSLEEAKRRGNEGASIVDEHKIKTVILHRSRETPDGHAVMKEWAVWNDRGRSCKKTQQHTSRNKDCRKERRECCSLIIWLFIQNAESPPIRDGDL